MVGIGQHNTERHCEDTGWDFAKPTSVLRPLAATTTAVHFQRRSDETEPGVEPRSLLVDRMSQHRSDSGLLGNKKRAANRILKHAKANAFPLILDGNSQTSQDNDRDRVTAPSLSEEMRSGASSVSTCPTVRLEVAHYVIIVCNDKCLG